MVFVYHTFVHSSVNGHVGCFHALGAVNSAYIRNLKKQY